MHYNLLALQSALCVELIVETRGGGTAEVALYAVGPFHWLCRVSEGLPGAASLHPQARQGHDPERVKPIRSSPDVFIARSRWCLNFIGSKNWHLTFQPTGL